MAAEETMEPDTSPALRTSEVSKSKIHLEIQGAFQLYRQPMISMMPSSFLIYGGNPEKSFPVK